MMILGILTVVIAIYTVVNVSMKSAALSRELRLLNQEIDRLSRSH